VLSRDDLAVLFDALRQVFRVPAAAEISAEIDPVVFTEDWARAAVFHGLTRVSLGVQPRSSPECQTGHQEQVGTLASVSAAFASHASRSDGSPSDALMAISVTPQRFAAEPPAHRIAGDRLEQAMSSDSASSLTNARDMQIPRELGRALPRGPAHGPCPGPE